MLTSSEEKYLHEPPGSGPKTTQLSLCVAIYMINKYFSSALHSAEKEGHSMCDNSLVLFCRNKRKLQVHDPRMEQELPGCQASSGWVSKALSGYLSIQHRSTQTTTVSVTGTRWHKTVLTSPFLLQSSESCCIKQRAGWQRDLQSGNVILQAAEMRSFMAIPRHQPN